jgi:hypothetical protein
MKTSERRLTPAAVAAAAKGDMHNAEVASTPGGIEAQEKAGQAMLALRFNQLPKEGMARYQEALEQLGFRIGADADDLFLSITPPPGWFMRPTDHSMHSDIVDDQQRVRGSVFYKAAFYDRKAHFRLSTRYQIDAEYKEAADGKWENGTRRAIVRDTATGEILKALDARPNSDIDYSRDDKERAESVAFLDEMFPDWKNIVAYW